MRIQEHLFQGFFGNKNKVDSAKYYTERVNKMKGLDSDLDKSIEEFQKILDNHNKKLASYYEFLKRLDKESLKELKDQINIIEGMYEHDEEANEDEREYCLKVKDSLTKLTANEENTELTTLEKDVMEDIKSLIQLLESISPLWEQQLEFVKKNDEEIIGNKNNLKVLSDILKEEGDILKMEENLLKKIDLKTGAILRKTTLKMRDVDKTKDMNLSYREIRHIR